MSNNTHTPGPWRTGDVFNTVFGPPNGNPSPAIVATVNKANKANARLIAAAPEMLEALETAKLDIYAAWVLAKDLGDKPSIDHCSKSLARVSAAIAKAKGL
jgi:hypothetical protein